MGEKFPIILLQTIVYLLLQLFFLKDVALFNRAVCLIYIMPILLVPANAKPWQFMLFAFATGLLADLGYATGGVHTGACVLIGFIRPHLLGLLVPTGGYDTSMLSIDAISWRWFLLYSSIMVFIHHFALFMLEAFSFTFFAQTILSTLASSLFTLAALLIFQLLFYRRS
ncbi:MAG: hypothetical protein RMJ44_09980 [Cytophagales bacterium]|nr:hypothetical protein [Bernardetiaceae bacterium]MDW8211404.1 hypothetical protein [Cytophagales bacterium]